MKLFISKLHYEKNPNLIKKIIIALLWLASIPYAIITFFRNFLYNKKILKSYDCGVKTISVGNLTTGGVGKTPFTAALANYYVSRCFKVAVVSRGYGGELRNKDVNVISDGKTVFYSAKEAGDEPFWLATNCPSVVVLTCSSRSKASEKAVKDFGCNVIIADDAFQHRKLFRNLDLVLIDQSNKFGNEHLLPAGPLRESFEGIKRSDALIVTNKSLDDKSALKYCDEIKKRFNKPVFLCKMLPSQAYNIKNNQSLYMGASALAFCAIGQPNEFFEFVKKDYQMPVALEFPDHHSYDEKDVEMLFQLAEKNGLSFMITTEKDAVKIKDLIGKFKTNIKVYALKLKAQADIEDIVNVK
jgi:tetraacyldisaccharide 4'-kinase